MVFGYSSAIFNLFKKAYNLKKNFKIIVVDNYPFYEGKIMVEELSKHDIPCIYTLLGSVPKFLPKINKVFYIIF